MASRMALRATVRPARSPRKLMSHTAFGVKSIGSLSIYTKPIFGVSLMRSSGQSMEPSVIRRLPILTESFPPAQYSAKPLGWKAGKDSPCSLMHLPLRKKRGVPSTITPRQVPLGQFDRSTGGFEGFFGLLGVFFFGFFENGLWRAINERLRFAEAELRQVLNSLNDCDFLSASVLQDNIVLRLFVSSGSGFAPSGWCGNSGDCSGRLGAVFVFQNSFKFIYFEDSQLGELLCQFFQICHGFLLNLISFCGNAVQKRVQVARK